MNPHKSRYAEGESVVSAGEYLLLVVMALLLGILCLAAWRVTVGGCPIGRILVIALLVYTAGHALAMPFSFMMARIWGGRQACGARLGPAATARMILRETLNYLLCWGLLHRLSRRRQRMEKRLPIDDKQCPILFVHGYTCRGGMWIPLINLFERQGRRNLYTISFWPPFSSLDVYAVRLNARLQWIAEHTGRKQIMIVCHSMGGLVTRRCIANGIDGVEVAHLVAIACPHHGTHLSRVGLGKNSRQMRVGSPWIEALCKEEKGYPAAAGTVIYSTHDNIIVPQDSARWGEGEEFRRSAAGHFSLVFQKETANLILAIAQKCDR